jgi:agmatine/peptidylarginine deiminase
MRTLVTLMIVTLSGTAFAQQPRQKIPDRKTLLKIERHNQKQKDVTKQALAPAMGRPFADYEKTRYVVFNFEGLFDSTRVKSKILQNLPIDVDAVVLVSAGQEKRYRDYFNDFIADTRLHVVAIGNANQAFWTRDALPVPAFLSDGGLGVVDAKYYHGFPQDRKIAELFTATLVSHTYFHEGGNFQNDDQGRCFLVNNNRAAKIPDSAFITYYGCKQVVRLRHVTGIGHVDEVVRLVDRTKVMTQIPEYKPILEKLGFQVAMLPKPKTPYGTYANSLIVNGTAFLPVYNEKADQQAINTYKSFGLNVVPIETSSLSKNGLGSIHCITMQYPETPLNELVTALTALN